MLPVPCSCLRTVIAPLCAKHIAGNVQGETDSFAERALRSKVMDLRGAGSPFTPVPETSEQMEVLSVIPRLSPDTLLEKE